jgi:tetratricopeptide (TPR) repeat protein
VLLAEALQEQSRWDESLGVLDQVELADHPGSNSLPLVLRAKARRRLGYIANEEMAELPGKLLTFIESSADKSSRIRAAVEAASVLNSWAGPSIAQTVLERLLSLDTQDLEPDDVAHLLLAKAMLFYNVQDLNSSLSCISEAIAILGPQQGPSSTLAMFHQGRGAVLTKQGEYEASVSAYLQCYQTASRIGNDAAALQAGGNIALSCLRLGQYRDALSWAERVLACRFGPLAEHYCLPALLSCVSSYAMLGKTDQAEAVIRKGAEDFGGDGTSAASQGWALYSADGYALLGKLEQAGLEGWRATWGGGRPLSWGRYAGPYARWTARTALSFGSVSEAHKKLDSLVAKLEDYDAIDKAEVLNAKAWLSANSGGVADQQVACMRRYLDALPPAVTDQLRCMGMFDFP